MYMGVIISLVGILAFYILLSIIQLLIKFSGNAENTNEDNIMEGIFFEQVNNGEKTQEVLSVSNQMDLMLIKSLLQSEQIPFYIKFEYSSRIFPGLQIGSFGNQSVYILEKDLNDAMVIIDEYHKNKGKTGSAGGEG